MKNYFTIKLANLLTAKKILIVRNEKVGDVILTLPLATLLKQNYPHLKVDFLLKSNAVPLAQLHEDIDAVFTLPENLKDSKVYADTLQLIREQHYDMVITIHVSSILAKLLWEAEIPVRAGRAMRLHSWRFNHWIFQYRKYPHCHEMDFNLDIIAPWVKIPPRETIKFKLGFTASAADRVKQFLLSNGIKNYLIIHPGSAGNDFNIPLETYAKFIDELAFDGHILITGSPGEKHLYQALKQLTAKPIIDATGQFPLDELICLISGCQLLVSKSTGPLHIARAMERPVIGFYSTYKHTHPRRWGPYAQEKFNTILPPDEKYEVVRNDKIESEKNMQTISLQQILDKANALLNSTVDV